MFRSNGTREMSRSDKSDHKWNRDPVLDIGDFRNLMYNGFTSRSSGPTAELSFSTGGFVPLRSTLRE